RATSARAATEQERCRSYRSNARRCVRQGGTRREAYAVLPWKLNELRRLLLRIVFFSLFVAPRSERLRMMLLGLWHRVLGRTGPLAR
ncbi:MAG: hypothetical protein ACREU7_10845, partial [Burkholderiales bacterium]